MWNLKPSKDVIDLCSDSEKDIEQKSAGESLQNEAVEIVVLRLVCRR